jgi:sarcosine oxidase subunit gamma
LPTTVGEVARVNADCPCGDEPQSEDKSIIALCLGPDWWFITGNVDVEALIAPLRDTHHLSIVDVSAQRTKIELWGPNSKEVLEHVWEQDLREKNFGIDKCTQGIMFHAPVILWHCCENCYVVFARSSFATHLWAALTRRNRRVPVTALPFPPESRRGNKCPQLSWTAKQPLQP